MSFEFGRRNIQILSDKFLGHEATRIEIHGSDSGEGIAPEIAVRIMEPFFTTKAPNEGTGLGLSLSSAIIQQHQGTLFLDTKSKNTRFGIRIPRAQQETSQAA